MARGKQPPPRPAATPAPAPRRRSKSPRPKHVPMRMCALCRTHRAKRDLVRIVRTLEGAVVIDPTGKRNGRGAYLCRQRVCWQAAFKRRTLEHALQVAIGPDDRAALEVFAAALPETLPSETLGEPSSVAADAGSAPERAAAEPPVGNAPGEVERASGAESQIDLP